MKNFTKIQNEKDITNKYYVDSQTDECVKFSDRGEPDGIPGLGSDGKVPYSQLPDFVKSEDKGVAGGVASLGDDGKIEEAQLPDMDFIPISEKGNTNGVATLGDDGKVPITELPVVPIENGGTGNTTGLAASATKLATARTIRTNLSSAYSVSFNGTANITPGVMGTLPISYGGTGATTLAGAKTALGIKDNRVARLIVGTSTAGWTADQVDYLCDGSNDATIIKTAIQALSDTGGEIIFLSGTYRVNTSGTISIDKDNITLSGNGNDTIFTRAYTGSPLITINSNNNVIQNIAIENGTSNTYEAIRVNGSYNSIIRNLSMTRYFLKVYGSHNLITNNIALKGEICTLMTGSSQNIISNNISSDGVDDGISVQSKSNVIIGNICCNNDIGIKINVNSSNNIVANNVCSNNTKGGIWIYGSNNSAIGNILDGEEGQYSSGLYCSGNNLNISNNICVNNTYGIYLVESTNNTIIGNTCIDFSVSGIHLNNSTRNNVSGNTCMCGTGTSSDYSSTQRTIYVYSGSTNNLITNNLIMGKNYTNSGGTTNTFANNKYS